MEFGSLLTLRDPRNVPTYRENVGKKLDFNVLLGKHKYELSQKKSPPKPKLRHKTQLIINMTNKMSDDESLLFFPQCAY